MGKAQRQSFPIKLLIVGFAIAIFVPGVVMISTCSSSSTPVVRESDARLQSWLETPPREIREIWFCPLLSGTEGPTTVPSSVVISNQSQVTALSRHLQSRRSRTSFLGPFGHWGDIRYAKLQVKLYDNSEFTFSVSWHDTGDICAYGLPRDPSVRRYIAGDIVAVGASDQLAYELNQLVVSNQLTWVPACETEWDISLNTFTYKPTR